MHPVVVEQAFFRYNFISDSYGRMAGLVDKQRPDQRQNEGQAMMYPFQTLDDLTEIVHCVILLEKQRCPKIKLWI